MDETKLFPITVLPFDALRLQITMARRNSFLVSLERAARAGARIQRERDAAARRFMRDELRQQRENIRLQQVRDRLKVQQHYVSRQDEAHGLTADVAEQVASLRSILLSRVHQNCDGIFSSLVADEERPTLSIPRAIARPLTKPLLSSYQSQVVPIRWWEKLLGLQARYERHMKSAEDHFQADCTEWEKKEEIRSAQVSEIQHEHDVKLVAYRQKVDKRDFEIQELRKGYEAGLSEAVGTFFEVVLEQSDWPEEFPAEYRIAYDSGARQLVLDYELPCVDVIPPVVEYRYVKSKDAIEEKARKAADIKELYRELISAVALRCVDECFAADGGKHLDVVTFSGFVNTIDRSTGNHADLT